MTKDSFIFRCDIVDRLGCYDDKDFRQIITAISDYVRDGVIPELPQGLMYAFNFIRVDIDKDRQKYNEKCEKNRLIALGKWNNDESVVLSKKQHNSKLRKERLDNAKSLGTHTSKEWEDMKEFFNYTCVRCNNSNVKIVKDHIIPIYQGGSDAITNIQPLCKSCNSSKGAETTDYRVIYCKNHNLINPYKNDNLRSQ